MREPRAGLTKRTVTRIMELIGSSGLEPGQPFATESRLAQEIGVSRQTVREAVRTLRALGYLRSKQNVGLIIGKPDPVALFRNALDGYHFDSIDIRRLGEMRFTLEVGAVELAIRRGARSLGDLLEGLADEIDRVVAEGQPVRVSAEVDLRFHGAILEATGNPVLAEMTAILVAFFDKRVRQPLTADPQIVSWEHHAIARAFRDKSVERARVHLSEHLHVLLTPQEGK
jgi:GntR family transcriptional regulator, transcriptional repressor for pyruvate dehydrogenase complex